MHDVIQIEDQWYVLATASGTDDRTHVLKSDDAFAIFDNYGDIQKIGLGEQGLYHGGTRFLSDFRLTVNGRRPMLLNSTVVDDNTLMTVDLTTPDLFKEGQLVIPKSALHIFRSKLLLGQSLHEHLRLVNYGDRQHSFELAFAIDNDAADIFEVRGVHRETRGECRPMRLNGKGLELEYRGEDGITRSSRISFSLRPSEVQDSSVSFRLSLSPGERWDLYVLVRCITSTEPAKPVLRYPKALSQARERQLRYHSRCAEVISSNERFNQWLNRSNADMGMLMTETAHGPYPYAGVPWFNTAFGRDGIISAMEMLWINPSIAKGVLHFLAAHQAEVDDPQRDSEPGKILHECRTGELANLGMIPFQRYYGTADATPLFIMLAYQYYRRTADRESLERLWPNVLRAVEWIDQWGDRDGDGFVEYERRNPRGILQQGWKDSDDPIFHADGSRAEPPVAVCEVQGYVYAARRGAAYLAERMGDEGLASRLREQAHQLRTRFHEKFWCEEIGTYAIALDGRKQPCRIRSSNAGQTLMTGIAKRSHAARIVTQLNSDVFYSGWGIRTLARGEPAYNPMSYHNGSIWPHDNAMIAMGFARSGYKDAVLRVLSGMYQASTFIHMHRLPELFCGFERLQGQGPTRYPVACSPQAWASGAAFYLLQASLGMSFDAEESQLEFHLPKLPPNVRRLEINRLRIGNAELDLLLRRNPDNVGVSVKRREGDIEVSITT